MDAAEVEENLFAAGDAKLHGEMCKQLSVILSKILAIFPVLEAARPRSKSGIQALCSLHVALDKAKNLLQHCSDCSKLYLAITGESILLKFEKTRSTLQENLRRVEDIVPQAIGCQIVEIVNELEGTVFALGESERQVGDEVVGLLQKDRKYNYISNDGHELEVFHQAIVKLGITSSRAALTERRALKKLIDRAQAEEDKRKESIVAYLLHLMRKYSKLFRSDPADDTDSQGSTPCSPTISSSDDVTGGNGQTFERHLSKLGSLSIKQNGSESGNMPTPPEEFRCSISLQLMYDPVIISSGQTYERVCIEKWFDDGHSTCPKTQQQLSHLGLTPNYCVKGLIASWCEQNGVPVPNRPPDSLDLNYWRLALSERDAINSRSLESIDSCKPKGVKVVPLEEEIKGGETGCEDDEVDDLDRYDRLLTKLNDSDNMEEKCKAAQQVRFLLKDDEEARIYMGANGFVEALLQFLQSAIDKGDEKAQEVASMALFNLAVNNNRNKGKILSTGVMPLLERMIIGSATCESATALYLNLSCLDDAKPVIGSSEAVPVLIELICSSSPQSISCKYDALYTLYNLSTYPPNIPSLLACGIIDKLHSLLTVPTGHGGGSNWAEKVLAVLINLASSSEGSIGIMSAPGLIGVLAGVLDTGEPAEQEQAVSCLLILCSEDEKCSHVVLQEGVIPALVLMSTNGTSRGKEKAQKLLRLFREQRQREPSPVRVQSQAVESGDGGAGEAVEAKPLRKSRSARLGKSLSSMWKKKSFSVHRC